MRPSAQLLALQKTAGNAARQPVPDEMLASGPRQRHELRDGRIRARYGHSVPGRIEHAPEPSPGTLLHGTSARALAAILADGLRPRGRQYVHLARSPELAEQMGRRRDARPALLEVDGASAARAGIRSSARARRSCSASTSRQPS